MSYFPTPEEIEQFGFKPMLDEDGDEMLCLDKGNGRRLYLEEDEGWAVVIEWLPDGPHGWVTCGSFEDLQYAVEKAFDVLAEGRTL